MLLSLKNTLKKLLVYHCGHYGFNYPSLRSGNVSIFVSTSILVVEKISAVDFWSIDYSSLLGLIHPCTGDTLTDLQEVGVSTLLNWTFLNWIFTLVETNIPDQTGVEFILSLL
ncbi:hypothetical protein Y032_0039g30 [Ancylostoma ceylanicum]|uniref:Uncharacterized protein n=1 Tax=Ancylostoma ceylanicum TaxID=53326 RepID=A0A016UJ07_9BILA|nr:hypothetical protein Y032_0039g30 [Ancylostoma ceylanicum]